MMKSKEREAIREALEENELTALMRERLKAACYLSLLHEEINHLMDKHRATGDNASIERAKYLNRRLAEITQ